jgi:co-chaperonin GroES (HSP10)
MLEMNLHNAFEELNKLYESFEQPVEELEIDEALFEDAEEEEIVIEDEPEDEEAAVEDAQLVLECSNCGGIKVMAEADVNINEETDLANVGDACQYCEEAEGYRVLGTLNPYTAEEPVEESLEESTAPTAKPSKFAWVVYDEDGEYVCAYPDDKKGEADRMAKDLYKATVKREEIIDESLEEGIFGKRTEKQIKASEVKVGDIITATDAMGKEAKPRKVKKVTKNGTRVDFDVSDGNMTLDASATVSVLSKGKNNVQEGIFKKRTEKKVKATAVKVGDIIIANDATGKESKPRKVKKVSRRGDGVDFDFSDGNMTLDASVTVTVLAK